MDESIQSQPMMGPQPIFMGHTTEGALQYQLECSQLAKKFKHWLKGEEYIIVNDTEGAIWCKNYSPMINDKGIGVVMSYINLYISGTKIFALTSYEKEYVSEQIQHTGNVLLACLNDNWKEFEIPSISIASVIVDQVTTFLYAILKKGEDANYLNFLKTTQTINEMQNYSNAGKSSSGEKEGGIFAAIFKKKRAG